MITIKRSTAETLCAIHQHLGFDPVEVVRRVRAPGKLRAEERQRRRRAQNAKAQQAVRLRRLARGLRGDGQARRRAYREQVNVLEVRRAETGEVWLRVAGAAAGQPPLRQFEPGMVLTVTVPPTPYETRRLNAKITQPGQSAPLAGRGSDRA